VARTLRWQDYHKQSRKEGGAVRAWMSKRADGSLLPGPLQSVLRLPPAVRLATLTHAPGGKRVRLYNASDNATPEEQLKSLPNAFAFLKQSVSFDQLDRLAQVQAARNPVRLGRALLTTSFPWRGS